MFNGKKNLVFLIKFSSMLDDSISISVYIIFINECYY